MPHLSLIAIYPLKGFHGACLKSVAVKPEHGLPNDRRFAIANGEQRISDNGEWAPPYNFQRLNKTPDLANFLVTFDPTAELLTLTSPDQQTLTILLSDHASRALADATIAAWFPKRKQGYARLLEATNAYWDFDDAPISIINLNTISEISKFTGRRLEPSRFRANFYIADLAPFEEFTWTGQHIGIGGCEVEIIRPIPRCRAPSVNPSTGKLDAQILSILARQYGHSHCGMYARVTKPGTITAGESVRVLKKARTASHQKIGLDATAPRVMKIVRATKESEEVQSLWIRDTLGHRIDLSTPWAGMYLRIHRRNKSSWRSYTISDFADDRLMRISVKRQGPFSEWLHRLQAGERIIASGPLGMPIETTKNNRLVVITGGVGVTVASAIVSARTLGSNPYSSLVLLHIARNYRELVLWDETIRDLNSHAEAHLFLTQEDQQNKDSEVLGRAAFQIALTQTPISAQYVICGPLEFARDVKRILEKRGIDPKCMRIEAFASPRNDISKPVVKERGPHRVTFSRSKVEAIWTPESGFLLDLAESLSVHIPNQCRVGVCLTCRQRLESGSVAHLGDSEFHYPESTLLCCAIPTTDIVIDA